MPVTDSPAIIVARFLKANHYTQTLEAFLKEAGLSEEASDTSPGDWTIEQILEEKRQYDSSLAFEKTDANVNKGWSKPCPSIPIQPEINISSNVLCVAGLPEQNDILMTTADRLWHAVSAKAPYQPKKSLSNAHGSPVLSMKSVANDFLLSTSMSGQLMLHHIPTGQLVDKTRDHLKYAVQVTADTSLQDWLVATAGWDQKVILYAPNYHRLQTLVLDSVPTSDEPALTDFFGSPIHTISLTTVPEAVIFVRHPDTLVLYLILSRRDSTHLYYYAILPSPTSSIDIGSSQPKYQVHEAGRQNLAPHANAWVAFSPSCLAPHPSDPTLLAIATSHLPHMKLIIVRLLFPGKTDTSNFTSANGSITQASQARAELAIQDREDAAISLHVSTLAPQTPYSTPQVVWRPDGTGVFVNGDDGVIRGIEVQSGKVVALLRGHEVGAKVRTLWAGKLEGREVLLSGGFDKKMFVWEIEKGD